MEGGKNSSFFNKHMIRGYLEGEFVFKGENI